MALAALIAFAVIVLLGDVHRVHERYRDAHFRRPSRFISPSCSAACRVSAYGVVPIAAVILYVSVFAGFWGMVSYGVAPLRLPV